VGTLTATASNSWHSSGRRREAIRRSKSADDAVGCPFGTESQYYSGS
jgi:hypothetical protein